MLLTSGILLAKHAARVSELCCHTIVSLDGAEPETYRRIRGVDGLAAVERGVRALVQRGAAVSVRCTVQRDNYAELPAIVRTAHAWGVQSVSFLAVDVSTHQAFARQGEFERQMALAADDLPRFDRVLEAMQQEFASDFASGFIAESPAQLRRLRQYFAALDRSGCAAARALQRAPLLGGDRDRRLAKTLLFSAGMGFAGRPRAGGGSERSGGDRAPPGSATRRARRM